MSKSNIRKIPYSKNEGNYKKINAKSGEKILKNIQKLYQNCKSNQKSNILAIVSNLFNRKYLNKLGFGITQKIYKSSKRKAENEEFGLNDYKRYKPLSKLKTSKEIVDDIVNHLKEYSINSGNTYYNENIYYLQQTKKYVYQKYVEKNPKTKISLTTFYRKIPKYFKVPKKISDICPICYRGKKLMGKNHLKENEKLDKEIYLKHEMFKYLQNSHFKEKRDNLKEKECIIIMDFKQNIILGKGPIETNHDFYNKEHASCLGFCVIYKKNNELQRVYINYVSSILSHDSLYVTDCIAMLIEKYLKNRFEELNFWSDNACHFRSFELYHHILKRIPEKNEKFRCTLNFFNEYHGKSDVDRHFGKLQKIYNMVNKTMRINDIEQLVNIFQQSIEKSKNSKDVYFEIYSREKRPQLISKMLVKGSNKYLSFVKKRKQIVWF